ncbi:carbohydrate ABC transporter permease [Spirochaeta lutea]|nr:sugar ABC transporter permease [Spirochaeta lutea]
MNSLKRNPRDIMFYIAMVAPALLSYIIVIAYPVIFSIGLGFTEYNIFKPENTVFIGFKNYTRMFSDSTFWLAFRNNMFVVAVSVFGQIPLSFILAYLLYRKLVRFQNFFQAMVFLPMAISTIVIGLLWRNMFSPYGAVTSFIQWISGNPEFNFTWSLSTDTAMIPIGLVLIWMYTGFYMINFLANLQKLDSGIIEAAQIDGASEFNIFFRIVVPPLAGVILVNTILAIAGSLKGFDLIFAMTGGGPANKTIVLPIYMYRYAFTTRASDAYSFGSAISNVIVLISIILITLSNWLVKKLSPQEV